MPNKPEIDCGSVVYPTLYGELMPLFHTMKESHEQDQVPDNHEVLNLPKGALYGPRDTIQTKCLSSKTVSSQVITLEGDAGV